MSLIMLSLYLLESTLKTDTNLKSTVEWDLENSLSSTKVVSAVDAKSKKSNQFARTVCRRILRESLKSTLKKLFHIKQLSINSISFGHNANVVKAVYMKKLSARIVIAQFTTSVLSSRPI